MSMQALFNTRFKGLDLIKYDGKTLDEVQPILATFAYSEDNKIWIRCLERFHALDRVFYQWYGDQEVLRDIVLSGELSNIIFVGEDLVDRLPEDGSPGESYVWHFKGNRKNLMRSCAHKMFNIESI